MYKNILIATDGSEVATAAVREGLELSESYGSNATVVTVSEPWTSIATGISRLAFPVDDYERESAAAAAEILESAEAIASELGTTCKTLHKKNQYPAEAIVETATEIGADLIVLGSHGRRGLSRLLLGSQANEVVILSKVPVLVHK